MIYRILAGLLFGMFAQLSVSDIDVHTFSSEEKQSVYQGLTRELRCPKCQNQDIADSNAPIAQDMRAQVHRLVEEGKSHKEVVDYMIERFGEFVTYKPKVSAETALLWYGPWVFMGLGLLAILLLAGRRKRSNSESEVHVESTVKTAGDPESTTSAQVQELLKKYDA